MLSGRSGAAAGERRNVIAAGIATFARPAEQESVPPRMIVGQARGAEGRQADVIHANNVLAHVADLNGVAAGLRAALKDGGVLVIEVPYVRDMIERCEFDTIYHEHLCYFSLAALEASLGPGCGPPLCLTCAPASPPSAA